MKGNKEIHHPHLPSLKITGAVGAIKEETFNKNKSSSLVHWQTHSVTSNNSKRR